MDFHFVQMWKIHAVNRQFAINHVVMVLSQFAEVELLGLVFKEAEQQALVVAKKPTIVAPPIHVARPVLFHVAEHHVVEVEPPMLQLAEVEPLEVEHKLRDVARRLMIAIHQIVATIHQIVIASNAMMEVHVRKFIAMKSWRLSAIVTTLRSQSPKLIVKKNIGKEKSLSYGLKI